MTINDLGKLARFYNPAARTDHILATKRNIPKRPSPTEVTTYDSTYDYVIDPAMLSQLQKQFGYSAATGTSSLWPVNWTFTNGTRTPRAR